MDGYSLLFTKTSAFYSLSMSCWDTFGCIHLLNYWRVVIFLSMCRNIFPVVLFRSTVPQGLQSEARGCFFHKSNFLLIVYFLAILGASKSKNMLLLTESADMTLTQHIKGLCSISIDDC